MRALATALLSAALASETGAEGLAPMQGTWSTRLAGGIETTFRLAPVEQGRISGVMCESYADASTLAWTFGPDDEPGVSAQVKFGVLEVRAGHTVNVLEIPVHGQDRIRYRARNQGDGRPFVKTRLKRTDGPTCADRVRARADARLEPVALRAEEPLLGEWSGVWRHRRVAAEVQIKSTGAWGRVEGVFCETRWRNAAVYFWDLDDVGARARRDGEKVIVTWKRGPAKWALGEEHTHRLEVMPTGDGAAHWMRQRWRWGGKESALTMTRGSLGSRGCLGRLKPKGESGWSNKASAGGGPAPGHGGEGR